MRKRVKQFLAVMMTFAIVMGIMPSGYMLAEAAEVDEDVFYSYDYEDHAIGIGQVIKLK
ncbi:MAG: hypothetical protein NC180_04470 [Muribaculaceae bacterium]|nr:hypothetical protein [Roseburia sp.]MCM1430341.1 hypothetical protein [Muribaculaceae bacterium]MCM1492463.1 hypothetical protein [Muribaculaceae bacterium]